MTPGLLLWRRQGRLQLLYEGIVLKKGNIDIVFWREVWQNSVNRFLKFCRGEIRDEDNKRNEI